MASKNEKRAEELGMSLKEYKASSHYKKSKKKKKRKKSSVEKKAKKKIKKYYKEKKEVVEERAKTETERYQEDLRNILKDSGIAQTRGMEDYIRNIGNIEANKAADIEDINEYVSTKGTRTQEDLDTSLAKETRRYSLEFDKINQELADRGLTFSERKSERVAREGSAELTAGIQTEAKRSFQDIARYEAVKNRDIELKYGQLEEGAKVTKKRTLENILNEQQKKSLAVRRGEEDIAFGKAQDIRDIGYEKGTDVALIGQQFEQSDLLKRLEEKEFNIKG